MNLSIINTSIGYQGVPIIKNINLELAGNEIFCVLGSNGVGKSTLFKTLLGLLKPISGKIMLNGKDIAKWNRREFAREIAYIPQSHSTPFPFKVVDVVLMGRTAHLNLLGTPSKKDKIIAAECLDLLGISHLKDNSFTHLSGGEKQLVIIARALAQQPSFLIMDEPTSNLDFGNQIKVIKQVKELKKESLGILMSTHSPDHAFMCNDKVIVLHNGGVYRTGNTEDVITEQCLQKIYNTDIQILNHEGVNSRKICVPII